MSDDWMSDDSGFVRPNLISDACRQAHSQKYQVIWNVGVPHQRCVFSPIPSRQCRWSYNQSFSCSKSDRTDPDCDDWMSDDWMSDDRMSDDSMSDDKMLDDWMNDDWMSDD
jgi:hypothetical protein